MDKLLYVAASGAKQNMLGIAVKANNLANAKTTGFKSDLEQARSMQAFGEGLPTRVFAMEERPASKLSSGAIATTGRSLDIAISEKGWLTVQDKNGKEAHTRAGNLKISDTGQLFTGNGLPVIGESGPIILPVPIEKIEIAKDGMIQIRPQGAPANFLEDTERLKLVSPQGNQKMDKGLDGLFRAKDQSELAEDPTITVMNGALEMSNVNPVDEMVGMISHQRQFELQIKMMKTAEEIDESQSSLMRIY